MRIQYLFELIVISLFLVVMIIATMFKRRNFLEKTAQSLLNFYLSIIVPLSGNMLAFFSDTELVAEIGYTIMLLGDCFLLYNLTNFVMDYCGFRFKRSIVQIIVGALLSAIAISVFLNPFFHHLFTIKSITLPDGSTYYGLESGWGKLLGFCLLQAILILIIAVLIDKCLKISSAYHERYIVIIFAIVTFMAFLFYSFSDRPVNKSLIGYLICGLLLFIFTFIYRPLFIRRKLADSVVENHIDGIIFYDTDVNAIYANDRAYEILKIASGNPDKCTDKLIEVMGGGDLGADFDISTRFKDDSGEFRYLRITHRLMKDSRDKDVGSFFSVHDDTDQVKLNAERKYLATHDMLTGLSNRLSFEEQVNEIIKANPNEKYYMVVSDINDFKLINDIYGKEKADEILLKIANDIKIFSHPGSAICRWRGDIFCAFAKKSVVNIPDLEKLIKDIWNSPEIINSPVVIHVGIFETSDLDKDISVSAMVDRAQLAIAGIKNDFNHIVAVYDNKLREDKLWEQQISSELDSALASGQIIPYLQPQYRADGHLEGGEVLVRWNHPKEGLIPPFKFIPIFEKNGKIASIDRYIWDVACKILSDWAKRKDGHENLNLSINISPKDFYFLDIFEVITSLVKKHDIDPKHLHLEITESSVMNNATEHIKTINKLREYGFTVEMDDFGSGYSSLNMLKDMPVDVLKIDMVFLGKTDDHKKSKIILNSIVDMANNLDMPQITEGVETKEQFEMLKEMGCKLFQGYFFSKPVPLEEFEKLPLVWE
ncbi:MAG: EAL domain-containing protein [Clostridiales bacterium]|nr:EAL domain-containing protein [Clostridiales bacterium]